jgi:phosphoribosylamine--glycine ligase
MNILLLGSGGREHALAWKLSQSRQCHQLFIAPGNPGTAQFGTNLSFPATDFEAVRKACIDEQIGMVIVGPEEPLVRGVVDFLEREMEQPPLIIGPSQDAAQLEGSKAFAKSFMQRHGIPTASYREFTEANFTEGIEYLKAQPLPIVLKADGLAAGKGVIICQHHVEAVSEFELMIQRAKFGEAGKRVVVEEFLSGIELSVFVLTDGSSYVILPEAKDYKRVGEGDTGPNTGGMGAISPVPFADEAFIEKVKTRIVEPTIRGLQADGLRYTGFIFCGLIRVGDDPFVIEYNCRMGDPETEVVMPRIKNDLVQLLTAAAEGRLKEEKLEQDSRFAATIVTVSGGYPNHHETGYPITLPEATPSNTFLFQAGTRINNDRLVTSGGRVICATALAPVLEEAIHAASDLADAVQFEEKYYRHDIGYEFL